jgi:cyclophilin family peptidyl-prolyl cis-trans isomerase
MSEASAKLLIVIEAGGASITQLGLFNTVKTLSLIVLVCVACLAAVRASPPQSNSVVRLRISHGTTLLGNIDIELYDADRPVTVSNFLAYVQSRKYDDSILHRCVPGFVLQGGGWTIPSPEFLGPFQSVSRISKFPAITNESSVGQNYHNIARTIAMARVGTNLNSAQSEWFFNLVNNAPNLDTNSGGYVVFGRATNGLEVLDYFNSLSNANILNMTSAVHRATCAAVHISPDDVFDYPFTELPVFGLPYVCPTYSDLFSVQAIMISGPDVLPPKLTVKTPKKFATLTNDNITLTGTASDNFSLALVRVSVGDISVSTTNNLSSWSLTLTNLPPGTNVALVEAVDATGNRSQLMHTFFRSVRVPFTLQQDGQGKVTGPTNTAMLEVGRGYTLTAKPARGYLFGGWSGSNNSPGATLKFLMQSNWNLTATFVTNFFPYVKGTYNGLFHDTNMVEQISSGFFTLNVADFGSYSGKLLLNGKSHSLKGTLWVDGTGTNTVTRSGTNALRVIMALDLTNGTDRITGLVSEETSSNTVWSVDLVADRAVFGTTNPAPQTGKYTMIIPSDTNSSAGPFGDGYGTVSVSSKGGVSFSGALADGTKVTQKTGLSKVGQWPLYVPLYKGKGALVSWVTFDTNAPMTDLSGTLNWFKQPQPVKYFPAGFTNESDIAGSLFVKPASTNWVINLTNAVVAFTNGNLSADFTNTIAIDAKGKVINESTNKLTLSASKSSGTFSGSATPPAGGKAVSFKGAVLQKQTNGFGFFLGTNASGRVSIEGR